MSLPATPQSDVHSTMQQQMLAALVEEHTEALEAQAAQLALKEQALAELGAEQARLEQHVESNAQALPLQLWSHDCSR